MAGFWGCTAKFGVVWCGEIQIRAADATLRDNMDPTICRPPFHPQLFPSTTYFPILYPITVRRLIPCQESRAAAMNDLIQSVLGVFTRAPNMPKSEANEANTCQESCEEFESSISNSGSQTFCSSTRVQEAAAGERDDGCPTVSHNVSLAVWQLLVTKTLPGICTGSKQGDCGDSAEIHDRLLHTLCHTNFISARMGEDGASFISVLTKGLMGEKVAVSESLYSFFHFE